MHSRAIFARRITQSVDGTHLVCRTDVSHPIGVIMHALERLRESDMNVNGKWEFPKYEQSSHVEHIRDSSVSYVSAYWVPTEQEA
jgi:predicted class III extradiol MEMO1 family dioxygenase